MKIVRAQPSDHEILTAITKQSKAHWGYSKEQLQEWDALLTVTPDYIANNETYKLTLDDTAIGYYSIVSIDLQTLQLDNLFILPEFIGKGFGKILIEDLFKKAALHKCSSIILDADPNAESFYSHFGFITVEQIETSVPKRFLPVMKKAL